jgi:hypothetical protein
MPPLRQAKLKKPFLCSAPGVDSSKGASFEFPEGQSFLQAGSPEERLPFRWSRKCLRSDDPKKAIA